MKFFVYFSLMILILAPLSSITCRKSSNKSTKRRNPPIQAHSQAPVATQVSTPVASQVPTSAPTQIATATSLSSSSSSNTPTSMPSSPVMNIERPYANYQPSSQARPVQTIVSRPPFLSGPPQGLGIVRAGFVPRPFMGIRRFAVVRRELSKCPIEFNDNSLIKEIAEYCPEICSKRFCIQTNEICCIYRDYREFHHINGATRFIKRK